MARVVPIGRWQRVASAVIAAAVVAATACVEAPPEIDDEEFELERISELELDEPAAASVLRRAREITVRIRTLGCRQLGLGSGFVLPGGTVVTNRHVVDQPVDVSVSTWDGRTFDARVDGVAVDSDLAILRLGDDTGLPVAELRTTPLEPGESIVVVGYPGGGPSTVSTGTVLGFIGGELLGEPADVIRIDAEIKQGNSGGPVLDEQGRVVGVVFALDLDSGHGLAVPATTLLDRLDAAQLAAPAGC